MQERTPEEAEQLRNTAYELLREGKAQEAQKLFEQLIGSNQIPTESTENDWFGLGFSLQFQERFEEALSIFDKLLDQFPKHVSALEAKTEILYTIGHYEEAAEYAEKVIEVDEIRELAWYIKGSALQSQNRIAEAMDCFEMCTRLNYTPGMIARAMLLLSDYCDFAQAGNALQFLPHNMTMVERINRLDL